MGVSQDAKRTGLVCPHCNNLVLGITEQMKDNEIQREMQNILQEIDNELCKNGKDFAEIKQLVLWEYHGM